MATASAPRPVHDPLTVQTQDGHEITRYETPQEDEQEKPGPVEELTYTHQEAKFILRKVDLRLLPILMLIYLHKNMDLFIVSYMVSMNKGEPSNVLKQLKMSTDDWGLINTFNTVPAALLEIPSNLLMKRWGPRVHFTRVVLLWSLSGALGAAAKNKGGLWATRFFLGVFEAGLYPGILAQLTYWYRPDELALRMILVSSAASWSSMFDALFAWGVTYMNGVSGLSSWQWSFILLGIVGAPLTALIWFFLPDFPDTSKFLTKREIDIIHDRLPPYAARASDKHFDKEAVLSALKEPLTWLFTAMQLTHNVGVYGLSFWLPSIIASFGFTTTQRSQLLNIPPTAIGLAAAITWAYLSDRTLRVPRPVYILIPGLWVIGVFFALAFVKNKPTLYAMTILASIGNQAFFSVVMPWRSQTLKGATHAGFVYAFQNGLSQFSGMIGPQVFRAKWAPRYTIPFMVCVAFQFGTLIACAAAWWYTRDQEKKIREEARVRREEAREEKLAASYENSI